MGHFCSGQDMTNDPFACLDPALLLLGRDLVVRGDMRQILCPHVSSFFVGMMVARFGGSLSETAVSIDASPRCSPGPAIEIVIGSN